MAKQFQDILDECINAVLDGSESIDSCCSRYPDWADELRPMLQIMAQGHKALQAAASAEAKEAGRARVMASSSLLAADCESGRRKSFFTLPRFILKPVALAAVLMLLLSGGTALAASAAGPDSFLYPVKRGMEGVRTALAIQDLDKAKVEVGHADARLDEVVEMVDEDKPEYVPELLGSYDANMGDTAGHLIDAAREGEDTGEVEAMMSAVQERHDEIMLKIKDRVPDDVRREIEDRVREAESRSGGYVNDGSGSGAGGMQDSDGEAEDGDFNTPGGSGHDGEDGADDGSAVLPGEPDGDDNPAPPPGGGDNGSVVGGGNDLPSGDGGGGHDDDDVYIPDSHAGEAARSSPAPPENQPGV